jgi:hemoglobin-like flavoprotein
MTARKLMTTLAVVVNGLSILPAASALAKRRVHYGVKADHYQPVGAALAVEPGARTWYDWTPPLAGAWTEAYKTLADYMIADASAARPSQVGHSWG